MVTLMGLCAALTLSARADDEKKPQAPKRPALTEQQKSLRKEMMGKYDKNKDGRLDAEERKAMSAEDKEKWTKAFPRRKKPEGK